MHKILLHKAIKISILILCGLLGLSGTIQATTSARYTYSYSLPTPPDDVTSITQEIHSNSDDAQKVSAEPPLPLSQLLIPANGHCLYTTIIMGTLLPLRQSTDKASTKMDQLFGMQPAGYLNKLHEALENPIQSLPYLHSDAFSSLVTAFMNRMQIKKGTWGGPQEIQTIANKLKANIQVYYPDPSNPTNLVQSDLTKSAKANSDITIHIVRDKVHPKEVLTQVEKASAQDNLHYQHYRLKYKLPNPIPHTMGSQKKSAMKENLVKWFTSAQSGNKKSLEELAKHADIDVDTKDTYGNTALLWSAQEGHLDCIKYLLQQGANIHAKNKNGDTALLYSASSGHLHCLKYLIQQSANVHDKNEYGNTALLYSASDGHIDCLKFLIQQNAAIHDKNKHGNTALILSAYSGHLHCLKWLIQKGASIHDKNKIENTALLLSAYKGQLDCLKYLLQQGTDINTKDKDGDTALLLSAQQKHINCLQYLLQQGADINTSAKDGNTALLLSAEEGHLDGVKFLLQQGANLHDKDRYGNTALLLSAQAGHVDCVKFLVKQGAQVTWKGQDGKTALQWAKEKKHRDVVSYLSNFPYNKNNKMDID